MKKALLTIALVICLCAGFVEPAQAAYVGEFSDTVNGSLSPTWDEYNGIYRTASGTITTRVPTNKCGYLTQITASVSHSAGDDSGVSPAPYLGNGYWCINYETWDTFFLGAAPTYPYILGSFTPLRHGNHSSSGTLIANISTSYLMTSCSASTIALFTGTHYSSSNISGKYKSYVLDLSEKWFTINNGHIQLHFTNQGAPFNIYYRVHNVTTGDVSPWFTESSLNANDAAWIDAATTGGNQYTYTVDYTFDTASGCFNTKNLGSVTADTQPPSGNISAPAYNKSLAVTLTMAGVSNDATHMQFKLDNGTWSAWETFASQKSFNVGSQGNHTIYVRFKDAMGNVSTGSISTSFNVDTTSPTGTIALNSGSTFVGNTADLVLSASDNNAVDKMIISDNSSFTGAGWQDYDGSYSLAVTGSDGSKTLYVKYRDPAGNESPVYSLAVTKDTVAPENCTMTLQGLEGIVGETKSQSITVVATGTDANGVAGIQVSNDSSSWSPLCTTKVGDEFQLTNYLLTEGRGVKTVYVRVYDAAGNFTLLSNTIRYDEDTTLPSCSIDLASPAGSSAYTIDPAITVKITANDNATFTSDLQYRLSNNGLLWSNYATFSPVVTWNLVSDAGGSTTEGARTVYINVKDAAGNVGYATATIAYSATRPESNSTPLQQLVNNSTDPNVNVTVGMYDGKEVIFANNNVVYMPISMDVSTSQIRYSIDGSDFGEWLPYNTASSQKINLGRGEGLVEVRYQGKNLSGAVSDAYTINFLYDYTPPVIRKLEGLKGATATKTGSITLLAEVSDNLSQIINYRYQLDSGAWSSLTALGPAGASNNFSVSGIVSGINVVGMEFQDVNGNIATGSLNIFGL